jgi:PilS N terminal
MKNNSLTIKSTRRQKGNGLIFAVLGIAMLGIGVAAALPLFTNNTAKAGVEASINEHIDLIADLKRNYSQTNYVGVTTAAVAQQGIFASLRNADGVSATNRWGGAITVADNNAVLPGTSILTSTAVVRDDCARFVNGIAGSLRQISIAGTVIKPTDGIVNPVTLGAQCQSAATVLMSGVIGR